ncbi:MAG: hypothetical protein LBI06_00165 [Treponema sp.]|jgi:hypothetical protein|nr:hypothetical protein [Treponema sp.]
MKKLIVFSAIAALLAPAVFAEVGVGAWARGTVNVLEGDSLAKDESAWNGEEKRFDTMLEKDTRLGASGSHEMRAEFSGENDEGTFGGHFKIWAQEGADSAFGWVWWKPIDQFQLQLGQNKWAWFEFRPLVAWGFYEAAGDAGVVSEAWRFGNAFYGGFGDGGAALSIYPVEGMAINFGIPFERNSTVKDVYSHLHAQFSYNISDVGTLAISYQGGKGSIEYPEWDELDHDGLFKLSKDGFDTDSGKIYAAFDISAIENVGLSIGGAFALPAKTWDDNKTDGDKANDNYDKAAKEATTFNPPVYVGVGFSYGADSFGFKARAMAGLGASIKPGKVDEMFLGDKEQKFGTSVDVDILPYFDLGIMNLYIAAGLAMYLPSDDQKDAGKKDPITGEDIGDDYNVFANPIVGFHLNPYITKSIGAGTFFAGVRIYSDGKNGYSTDKDGKLNSLIKFKVPIAIIFGF